MSDEIHFYRTAPGSLAFEARMRGPGLFSGDADDFNRMEDVTINYFRGRRL